MVAVVSATICAPAATASPSNEAQNSDSSFISQSVVDKTTAFGGLTSKTLSGMSVTSFSAHVTLNDSSGPQVIDSTDSKQGLSNLLQAHGFDVSDFRTSGDTALSESYQLKDGENLSLFKSEASGTSSEIILPAPVEKRNSDTLYLGEEKIETAGKDGKALRTVITTKNLAADSTVNAAAAGKTDSASSEEKLTILIAPEPKVILVGTKERLESNAAVNSPVAAPAAAASTSATTRNTVSEPTSQAPAPAAIAPSAPVSGSTNGAVNRAMAQLGKPYVYGAAGANAFDCSGLVKWAFGGNLPRTAYAQGLTGTPVNPANMQPGDLVYTSYHIGIYVGNGKMVHAATPATGVILDDVKLYLAQGYKVSRL